MTIKDLLEKNKATNEIYEMTGIVVKKTNANDEYQYTLGFYKQDLPLLNQLGFKTIKEYIIHEYGPHWVKSFCIIEDKANNGYIISITY